ncbi:hypothetical protein CRES_0309 [Corynebacterium resistens DSM 45100]|uniref:Uncharacterized protein n=1 Tax=Corynebacterium resistens (strain DSM 45100 / JCM 12819 / GTC 2026 / SICGH 158) TaxID=662755 RepID=F8E2X4_CORRG|nr:hypothetical protein [Corynebacterium resistens]AEI08672.1 hypothetical protein CRES_0309 [Corynebacterium resistens DSM 45100]
MHLLRLLRHFLRPYTGHLVAILILQTLSTLAVLYLPTLNARIIDKGVGKTTPVNLVMQDGSIVEQGNHEELLARGGSYAQLYAASVN